MKISLTDCSEFKIEQQELTPIVASNDQPIKEILRLLHWYPIHAHVILLVLMFRTKCGTALIYIRVLITTGDQLRSIDDNNFNIPRTQTKLSERLIEVIGPKWWKALKSNSS